MKLVLVIALLALVGSSAIKDICKLPAVTGYCRAGFLRYFYNHKTRRCEQFTYGGCDGNDNNFEKLADCNKRCKQSSQKTDICKLPAVTGNCRAGFPKYYYDTKTKRCRRFTYGGCGGNENNFRKLADCKKRCSQSSQKKG